MSAYLVEDKTITRVLDYLAWEVIKDPTLRQKVEEKTHLDTANTSWTQTLGQRMYELNIQAVIDRYGEEDRRRFIHNAYHYAPVHGSRIQVLKSLQCWLYQCAEGETTEDPLYQFFDRVIERRLTNSIIRALPEYEQAEWG
jgi:hypothetical protein